MPDILSELSERDIWLEYYQHKLSYAHLSRKEERELYEFIQRQAWQPVVAKLNEPSGNLGIPEKRLINKLGKSSKRVVYSFDAAEQQVLKVLAWLLYRYDDAQPTQCFSFRRGQGAHKAIRQLASLPQIDSWYCYKLDIQDYFNSIDTAQLLPIAKEVLSDDELLYDFFARMLTSDLACYEGELVTERRGVMAGTPTAPFFANLYLREMDQMLAEKACAYARYSDDIIMFAQSESEIESLRTQTATMLANYGLKINPAKEQFSLPGEAWEFLGISYTRGVIDLSKGTQQKLKGKIRRKARALRRWMLRKEATPERAVAAMIRSMNRKLFDGGGRHELTWARWFFPLITTSKSLAVLDAYMQQELRTITTGKHGKLNYRMSYDKLKELGYRSLVNEYYRSKDKVHMNHTL